MKDPRLSCSFDYDAEMWQVYDYAQSVRAGGRDVYWAPTWEPRGGVRGSGYIWADDARWSIDTPEQPHSVLALMTWRQWVLRGPVDLRGAQLAVYLRGDNLDLKGGACYFWALSLRHSTRWHFSGRPLPIARGAWSASPATVTLDVDESLWHRSWAQRAPAFGALAEVLAECDSYGFSFVGFAEKPTGRFCLDEFSLKPRPS